MLEPRSEAKPTKREPREATSWAKIILTGSTLVTALSAFLFLIGWNYLDGFYIYFGVDPVAFQLPGYAPLIASYLGVRDALADWLSHWQIWCLLAVLILWVLYKIYKRRSRFRPVRSRLVRAIDEWLTTNRFVSRIGRTLLFVIYALTLLTMILHLWYDPYQYGRWAAESAFKNPGLSVHLAFKSDMEREFDPELLRANSQGHLYMLFGNQQLVVLFVSDEGTRIKPSGVYEVPLANLLSVRIGHQ